MAEIGKDKVFKKGIEVISIIAFAEKYCEGISTQAVGYAIYNDKIDYIKIGRERLIVLTEKTKSYVPNFHPNRTHKSTMEL